MQLEGPVAHTGPDTFIIRVHFYLGNGGDKNDYSAVRRARRAPPGCRPVYWCHGSPGEPSIMGTFVDTDPLLSSTSTCCKSFKQTVLCFMGPLSFNNRNKSLVISCWIFTQFAPKSILGFSSPLSFSCYTFDFFSSCIWFLFCPKCRRKKKKKKLYIYIYIYIHTHTHTHTQMTAMMSMFLISKFDFL